MARRRLRPPTELSDFLDALLKRKGMTHNQFSEKVGMTPSSLSDLKLRTATSVEDAQRANEWAQALGLTREEHAELFRLLELSRCSPSIQEQVKQGRAARDVKWVAEPPLDYR